MNTLLVLIGLLALAAIGIHLARLVARDGLGSNPVPRSHATELGTWVDRELGR
jgi:hypothetical protein